MSCPSRGGSKPLHPFAFILASIIRTTITKKVVEEEGPRGSPNWRTLLVAMICTVNITEVVEGEGGKTGKESGSHINGSHKSGQDKGNNMGILGKIFSSVCRN